MTKYAIALSLFVILGTKTLADDWKPVGDRIKTEWAAKVAPENAWKEYPRPQMVRENWQNLNGLWNYAVKKVGDNPENKTPSEWEGKILVPFCIESSLSGVQRILGGDEQLWYERDFEIKKTATERTILHFEAVDYACEVWVNGKSVGTHKGGNTVFKFDITAAAVDGKNQLVVMVTDTTGGFQLRGKQTNNPRSIWYTRVSGIWQTVWLEQVSATHIDRLKIDTEIDPAQITIQTTASGDAARAATVRVTASFDGKRVAEATGTLDDTTVQIPEAKLWSPKSPSLYDLKVELLAGDSVLDSVNSYIGLRKVGKVRDSKGHLRFTLNDEVIFHLGPLDQGWWPDGLLTPPSDEAMLSDIEYLKEAGFNMIRSHIKVRPRRYYYHCDRLGMMMWQDQVSGGPGPRWTRMQLNPSDKEWPADAHAQYMYELKQMIDSLYNSTCIVQWVPFNEAWGQHLSMEVGKWVSEYDKTRHNNIASGGNFWPVGDVADYHSYPHPDFPLHDPRFADYLKVVGEFGGHGFVVSKDHLWNSDARNWGYGGLPKSKAELLGRYKQSIQLLNQLRAGGIAGGVYTQTTDVEGEVNGLITYDRAVRKFPAKDLAQIHSILFREVKEMEVALPISKAGEVQWQYTTEKPADDWMKADFGDSEWKTGKGGFGTAKTPGSNIGTVWDSEHIWIRTKFDYDQTKGKLILNLHYDENPVIYINGVKAAETAGCLTGYTTLDISPEALASLKQGENTIAIECENKLGGQFIDAGLLYEQE
jgi:hypothetical protein